MPQFIACRIDIIIFRSAKIRCLQIGILEFAAAQIGSGKIRARKIGGRKLRFPDRAFDELGISDVQPGKIA